MEDKEILYQVLRREIDNIIGRFSPSLRMFSNTVSNYVINYIDPYIDAFMSGENNLNAEAAGEFVKEEANARVDAFMKKFNDKKSGNLNV